MSRLTAYLNRRRRHIRARNAPLIPVDVTFAGNEARLHFGGAMAGREVYFRARNLPDAERKTADFALLALCIIGMSRGRSFRLDAPVSESAVETSKRYMRFWRMLDRERFAPTRVECPIVVADPVAAPQSGEMVCLSGGVDSTYALLNNPGRFKRGLLIKGSDYPADSSSGFDDLEGRVGRIAATQGLPLAVVETDLREHFHDWTVFHTGMLVSCLKFALCDSGRGAYASDFSPMQEALIFPWGNMRAVAELLTSPALEIDQLFPETLRTEKVGFLASQSDGLLADLSICYEKQDSAANCGRCRKCLMTRVALQAARDAATRERAELAMFGSVMDHIGFIRTFDVPKSPAIRSSVMLRLDDLSRGLPPGPLRDAVVERLEGIAD